MVEGQTLEKRVTILMGKERERSEGGTDGVGQTDGKYENHLDGGERCREGGADGEVKDSRTDNRAA